MSTNEARPLACTVDDDPLVREPVEGLLQEGGFKVDSLSATRIGGIVGESEALRTVLQQIAANGGNVPKELLD